MWQDFVFMVGSALSIAFLAPTLRDADARVPLETSLPSMGIGAVYACTFASLGMTFSALGSFSAAVMWSSIALLRSPGATSRAGTGTRRQRILLFAEDARRWLDRRRRGRSVEDQFLTY